MKLWNKDLNKQTVLIAEVGVNHEGSITRAKKIIKDAKKGGADAIKLRVLLLKSTFQQIIKKDSKVKKIFLSKKKIMQLMSFAKERINLFFHL